MPKTFQLIASNTLSSAAASVTFSSIPGTYTDLVIRMSARQSSAFNFYTFNVILNTGTAGLYSYIELAGSGGGAFSGGSTNTDAIWAYGSTTSNSSATTNTFGSAEIYIPNYTASQEKQIFASGVTENNATSTYTYVGIAANSFRSTSAITQIEIDSPQTSNWVAGSSFFLYGIKKD